MYEIDSGIQKFKSLNNLRKLFLWQTNVTEEEAEQLCKVLSDIDIYLGLLNTTNVAVASN